MTSKAPFLYIEDDATLADLADALYAAPDLPLACDTETTGLDPLEDGARLLLLQIAVPEDVPGQEGPLSLESGAVYVINACKCDLSIIKPVLEDGRLLLFQNAKFDLKWLRVHADIRPKRLYDTMIAELLLIAGIYDDQRIRRKQASLKAQVRKYFNVEMDKTARTDFVGWKGDDFPEYLLQYAADDVPVLFEIKTRQVPLLREAGLVNIAKIEFDVLPAVAAMELNGIGLNYRQYSAVVQNARLEMKKAEETVKDLLIGAGTMTDLFGDADINIGSGTQLLVEFRRMGIRMPDGKEVPNTEEATLKQIDHPLIAALLDYREWSKKVSVYGEKVLQRVHPVTGRIHAEFSQLGSDAGRFSCDSPNIQQMPATKLYRSCFIPAPGNVLVVGDYSQFELRILCRLSGDRGMLDAFLAGRDLHSDTAARMYGLRYEEVDKHHPARQDAKILNFALAYGMGPQSLAVSLKCSTDEAKAKIERYFAAYPGVKAYLDQAGNAALRNGETRTLLGRRRQIPPPVGTGKDRRTAIGAIQRKGKNTPVQGSNADFLKIAMATVEQRLGFMGLDQLGIGLVACVHDEIVLEVPQEFGFEAKVMLEQEMVAAAQPHMGEVPVKADVGIADCWLK